MATMMGDIENSGSTFTPEHCITTDPLFADATNGDYRLYNISPCVDTGDNSANNETYDIRGAGFGRKLLKTDHTATGTIDIGAYEYKEGTDPCYNCHSHWLPLPALKKTLQRVLS